METLLFFSYVTLYIRLLFPIGPDAVSLSTTTKSFYNRPEFVQSDPGIKGYVLCIGAEQAKWRADPFLSKTEYEGLYTLI